MTWVLCKTINEDAEITTELRLESLTPLGRFAQQVEPGGENFGASTVASHSAHGSVTSRTIGGMGETAEEDFSLWLYVKREKRE